MDYRYLKAFILTAEFKSFSKAASELKIAQSAVSRQIKLLEESLNEELIIRSSKKIILTERGKQLYLAAMQFDNTTKELFDQGVDRTIRIGTLDGLVDNWLTNIIVKYYKKENLNIQVQVERPSMLKSMLAEGKFDIIFTMENIQNEIISSLKLFEERLILISKKPIDTSALHEERWIVFSERDPLYQTSKKHSNQIITIDSMTSIVNLVKNNVGIALIPDHAIKPSDNLCIDTIKSLRKSEIFLSTLNYKVMPVYLKNLISIIQTTIRKKVTS